jgi:hypothetical protein
VQVICLEPTVSGYEGLARMENKFSIIPQVFYDFISRVPAGAIFLAGLYFIFPGEFLEALRCQCHSTVVGVLLSFLALILSYIIGFFLGGVVSSVGIIFPQKSEADQKDFKDLCEEQGNPRYFLEKDYEDDHRFRIKMNIFLRHRDPQIALEMAKHQAEAELFKNLTVAFLILLVIAVARMGIALPTCCAMDSESACHRLTLLCILVVLVGVSGCVAIQRSERIRKYYIEFCRALFKIPVSESERHGSLQ